MNYYEIKNSDYTAKIDLDKGANCIQFRNTKYDVHILKNVAEPFLCGMPILFPANRIKEGRFVFETREYRFPINEPSTGCHLHGNLHHCKFELLSAGTDFAVCYYRPRAKEEFFGGIHEFEIVMLYRLTEKGLEQRTTITNCSETNMPLIMGFHTTFAVDNETTCVYADVEDYVERDSATYLPTGNIIQSDEITEQIQQGKYVIGARGLSRFYKAGKKGDMYIHDLDNHNIIRYSNSANMRYRMLFKGNSIGYICLEPQNCMIDCLNGTFDSEYSEFQFLKPDESETYSSSITFEHYE